MNSRSARGHRPHRFGLRARALVLLLCVCSAAFPQSAAIEDDHYSLWTAKPSNDLALTYESPEESHPLRAFGLQLAVLVIGLAYYYGDRELNAVDWEYGYEWSGLEAKLTGEGYSLDTNYFDTNTLAHPFAGTFYYLGARSNRMSPVQSLGVAFLSSTLWEFVAEFRERVSVNDMLVTPLSGVALGESMIQLGALFDRSCDSAAHRALGATFAPLKTLHDRQDGAKPLRATACDRYGFSLMGEHDLRLGAGAAWVTPVTGERAHDYAVAELHLSSDIVHLRRWGEPGHEWRTFSDGNLSELQVDVGVAEGALEDLRVSSRTALAGVHHRDIVLRAPGSPHGSEYVVGAGFGVEYARHRYGGQGRRLDPFFVLEAPALIGRIRKLTGKSELEASLAVAGTYGAAGVFALDDYSLTNSRQDLTGVARLHGYNHALGVALAPRLTWTLGATELGLEGRADRLFALRALDSPTVQSSDADVEETRRRLSAWVAGGQDQGLRWNLGARLLQRTGRIEDTFTRHIELRLGAGLGVQL